MEELHVGFNAIKSLEISKDLESKHVLPKVKLLNLEHNQIENWEKEIVTNLSRLPR